MSLVLAPINITPHPHVHTHHTCTNAHTHTHDLCILGLEQVNPVKRITIQGIKDHAWFKEDLSPYLFPLPGHNAATQIDSGALSEVSQKLSVPVAEVIAAVRSEDPHDQLAVAYQLVVDNKVLSKAAHEALRSEDTADISLATTPPRSSFNMKEAFLAFDPMRDLQPLSPARKPKPALPMDIAAGSSTVPRIPRTFKRSKWHLGIRSQSRPQDIMAEIFRKLRGLDFQWKIVTPYFIRCRSVCTYVSHSFL